MNEGIWLFRNPFLRQYCWKLQIGIIPARLNSTRLPGKPLILIHGVPMIIRTARQALLSKSLHAVYVATDDDEVLQCCQRYGINVVMTGKDVSSGG